MPKLDETQLARMRNLRRSQTDAERTLWRDLRSSTFQGLKFRRQHSVGPFILDFYCPTRKLAIELDGGQHNAPTKLEYDARRTAYLRQQQIRVVRFWNNDVLKRKGDVLQHIWNEVNRVC